MIEQVLDFVSALSPFWIYVVLFIFSFLENVFPPAPSDLVVIIAGSLVATQSLHFIPTLFFTTLGSLLGFMTLFYVGSQLDKKIIRTRRIKFISIDSIDKVENWFLKYGYFIILINRFLPGTRSVISFFAGLSELNYKKTAVLAFLSAVVWNSFIIYLGYEFGKNIQIVDNIISTYSDVVLIITFILILFFIFRAIFCKKKKGVS
jgi:membrane protein DedA with SNARE-associated domain